jgi:hypothetical protein
MLGILLDMSFEIIECYSRLEENSMAAEILIDT